MEARSHRPPRKCEMNFRNNLTAFSWKRFRDGCNHFGKHPEKVLGFFDKHLK